MCTTFSSALLLTDTRHLATRLESLELHGSDSSDSMHRQRRSHVPPWRLWCETETASEEQGGGNEDGGECSSSESGRSEARSDVMASASDDPWWVRLDRQLESVGLKQLREFRYLRHLQLSGTAACRSAHEGLSICAV